MSKHTQPPTQTRAHLREDGSQTCVWLSADNRQPADKQEMGAFPPPSFLTAEGERKPGKCASTGRVYIYPMVSSTLTSTTSALLCISEMLHDSKQPLS